MDEAKNVLRPDNYLLQLINLIIGVFNKLTLIGLFDINAIGTIGSGAVDYAFVWKFGVLAAVAVVCYVAGAIRFQKKDLPL